VTRYNRNGTSSQVLTPVGGYVSVAVSGEPCYLVRSATGTVYEAFLPLVYRHD
jgi:hypothetical protein